MNNAINDLLSDFAKKLHQQRYAPSSIKTYKNALAKFLVAFQHYDLEHISGQQIQNFIHNLQVQQRISTVYQKQILVSITKFYLLYYNRKLNLSAFYPTRQSKPLPKYLTVTEVNRLLRQCTNLKHLCILKALYGCGLRVSEVIALKVDDVDPYNMRLMIQCDKGQKVRIVPLPKSLLRSLRKYDISFRPTNFLFEGRKKQTYSVKSIQTFIKKYAKEAGITKVVTPHILRHSYAAHQLEKGLDIRHLQEIMGHQSIKTTERYIHILDHSKNHIANPLDRMSKI